MNEYFIDESLVDKVIKRLPQSDHVDKVTTWVRGVLSSKIPLEEQRDEVKRFIYQNFVTNKEYRGSRGRYNQVLVENFSREEKMMNAMKNSWLALEIFIVDYLNRNQYKYSWIHIDHTKGSPYLDHKRKIDYISHIQQKNKRNIHVWVQLTTEQSGIKIFPKSYENEMKKKRKIIKNLSNIIYDDEELIDHETYPIDMTSYMIINWSINHTINLEKNNIFLASFQKWKAQWLWGDWPIKFLPKKVRKDLWKIWLTYHLSLLDMTKFINKWVENTNLRREKSEEFYTHKEDAYIIRRSYIPEMKELSHNVFIGHNTEKEKLLFSMSYFLNDNITPK